MNRRIAGMAAGTLLMAGLMAGLMSGLTAGIAQAEKPMPVRFKDAKAVIIGDDGAPLYRADEGFVFVQAKNPGHLAFGWDAERRLVRLSPEDADGLWVACDALRPAPGICDKAPAGDHDERGGTRGGPALPIGIGATAVPDCPGDPRCP